GFLEFTVVFGLIWAAWVNGSLYLELHGREDGRTRSAVFLQMGALVLLAVFTADAAGDSGTAFALVYAAFLAVMTWLWYSVRRQDRLDHPEFLAPAGRYVLGMAVAVPLIVTSAFLPDGPRLVVWTGFCVAWLVGIALIGRLAVTHEGLPPTHSLVERFGLFTIIVLGEVVFGVVDGLSTAHRDGLVIVTGMIALAIGFGFWWVYFDLVGRRPPRNDGGPLVTWMLSHLPITLSIAAAGAAMVSLISHAGDDRTPAGTAWLLAGSVALGLLALTFAEQALIDADRLAVVYRPLRAAMAGAAVTALAVGWTRPAPWLSPSCSSSSSRCSGSSPSAASCKPTPGVARSHLTSTDTRQHRGRLRRRRSQRFPFNILLNSVTLEPCRCPSSSTAARSRSAITRTSSLRCGRSSTSPAPRTAARRRDSAAAAPCSSTASP
ncbi:MAG: low temperature requirement protein A, partial [Acidimicrobiales bacterium]